MSETPKSPISRRRFLHPIAAIGGGSLLGGRRSSVPAQVRAQGSLKGTKLTIIGGDSYVPEKNKLLDDLVATQRRTRAWTSSSSGSPRPAGGQGRRHREQRPGGDVAVLADFDAHQYGDKLSDVTEVANDLDKAWDGWYDVAKQACIAEGKWSGLMVGQAPAAWNCART